MPTSDFKVVHVSPRVQARGGIETLHAHHLTLPLPQHFVALLDRAPAPRAGYVNLNFNWRTPLGRMRSEFARAMAPHRGSVVIYHNAWCLPLLHGGDGAARRLAFCHARPAFHARDLPGSRGLLDGVLGITPALVAAWPELLPELDPERTGILPLPIEPPAEPGPASRTDGEIVLGYAGRLVREQKRLDRLPEFLRALDATGLRYRFELLGDGPLRPWLECRLAGRAHFHGWTDRKEYWRVLAGWDGIVFLTDNEGGPIALIEAMAKGAIPFYPRIGGSVGDEYAPRVDPLCYFAPDDLAAAAAGIRELFAKPPAEIARLRARSRELVAAHTVANYGTALIEAVGRMAALPRLSAPGDGARWHWSDLMPLGLVTRTRPDLLWRRR